MCGLFGFTTYGEQKKNYTELLQNLAEHSAERGTHATGISYNRDNKLITYKKPSPAYKLKLQHYDGVKAIIGHTRHATQGDYKLNYNNHPFTGHNNSGDFAVAHNGIIYNDNELQKSQLLPKSKITTDSYVYTQLLEKSSKLDFDSIAKSTELLQGYYTFTILTTRNELYIVKGDSPLSIIHFPQLQMYVYASTDNILYNALMDCGLFRHVKQGNFDVIELDEGDIFKINSDGTTEKSFFRPCKTSYNWRNWYDFIEPTTATTGDSSDDYLDILLDMAEYNGYCEEDIYQLLDDGYTLTDIEDLIYTGGYIPC